MNPWLLRLAALKVEQTFALALVVAVLYYMTLFDDGASIDAQIQAAKQQIATERTKEKESDEALARIKQLRESYSALTDQFKIVSTQIPTDMQMSEIIRTVDTMAKTSGILIKAKEPRLPIREDIVETLPIRVEAEGSYSELAMFIYNLSTIERIYRVRSFSIKGPAPEDKKTTRLHMDAEVASYRFAGTPSDKDKDGVKK